MASNFVAHADLKSALGEVEILLSFSQSYQAESDKYAIFNKAAILLLVAKFESFLEEIVEEYVYKLEEAGLCVDDLQDDVKLASTNYLTDDEFIKALRNTKQSCVERIELITSLWQETKPFQARMVDAKFSFGKHGEKEIVKLFKRIGIDNVFERCAISEVDESMATDQMERKTIDFVGDLNSLIGIRHYVIHEDGSPSITHEQIATYSDRIIVFSDKLAALLAENVEGLSHNISTTASTIL